MYWFIVLSAIIMMVSLIPARPTLDDLERFTLPEISYPSVPSVSSDPVVEHFGYDDDRGADWELVKSGLNDCNAIVGTGNGIRDMFDFSNRFIETQITTSNSINPIQRGSVECR